MIKLSSFKPEFFDNNGDQGNLAVTAAQFSALNVEFDISHDYQGSDFLLVGITVLAIGILASWIPSKKAAAQAMEHRN